ncbi:RecX family transcriptional regulator [Candidatus Saccharibacteria bacterium]|nr:RecX family transcriptional regulator [Candidatus Saccharibacteria bacterium]
MEIYKLKDEIEDEKGALRGAVAEGGETLDRELRITDLKQGVKNPNRVNVFVNGKYAFSLDVAQIVDFKLKVGLVVFEEQLAEYKKASEFGKMYQRALEWALMRPRSVRELQDYLVRKLKRSSSETLAPARRYGGRCAPFAPVVAQASSEDLLQLSRDIIERLTAKGYIDDRKFAEFWVENRFVKKGVSKKRLRMELIKKGVTKEIVEEVLDGRNDEEEIKKMIAKKRAKYDDEKLIGYLCRQGFSYDLVQRMVQENSREAE